MKRKLVMATIFALFIARVGMSCGNMNPADLASSIISGKHVRDIKSRMVTVPGVLDETSFFCFQDKFVIHAPLLNTVTDFAHPTKYVQDAGFKCSEYEKVYFDSVYLESKQKGGTPLWVGVSEYLDLVAQPDGSQKCELAVHEFIDFVQAGCIFDDKRLVLAERPLKECL